MKIIKVDKCYNCPELKEDAFRGLYCGKSLLTVESGHIIDPKCNLEDATEEFMNILKEEGEK